MIVKGKRDFPGALLMFHGSALEQIWPWILASALISSLLTFGLEHIWTGLNLTTTPFTVVGLALSIFLGFRNRACYDRWWEGRKLWGRLINVSRVIARQLITFVDGAPADKIPKINRMLAAYPHILRQALRGEDQVADYSELLNETTLSRVVASRNRPTMLAHIIAEEIRDLYRAGHIDPLHLPAIDSSLTEIAGIQGACERIKKTPVPMSYTELVHRIVALYVLALPFGIVEQVQDLTPVVVVIVAYCFLGLDAVGSQIEAPFDHDPNDLPLSAMSRMIENDVLELAGETELRAEVTANKGILN